MGPKEDMQEIIPEGFKHLKQSFAKRELILLVLAAIFLFTTILFALGLGVNIGVTHDKIATAKTAASRAAASTCMKKGCLKASSYMLQNTDTTVKPCDDFYQYACGGYIKDAHIKPYSGYATVKKDLREKNYQRIRTLLEKPIERNDRLSYERKLKEFYKVCLHDYDRLKDGGTTLVDRIKNDLGGWYLLDPTGWKNTWSKQDGIIKLQYKYISPVLFDYYVTSDLRRPSTDRMIYLSFPSFGMWYTRYLLTNRKSETAYKKYMRKTAFLLIRDAKLGSLSYNEKTLRIRQFISDAYGFEKLLANLTRQARSNKKYKFRKYVMMADVADTADQLDWVGIFDTIFEDVSITTDTEVILGPYLQPYLTLLNNALKTYGSDLDRVLNNYFTWTFIRKFAPQMSWEYLQNEYDLRGRLYGTSEWRPTWESCIRTMTYAMREGLSAIFVQNHFDAIGKDHVTDLVELLRSEFFIRLNKTEWMDETTRNTAVEKVKVLEGRIGHPDYMNKPDKMDRIFAALKVNKSAGYFTNYLDLIHYRSKVYNKELQEGNVNRYWKYGTFLVGPLYHGWYNEILVPAGAMQFPFYDANSPQYMNYGAIGTLAARTLIASVDEFGSRYAKDGQRGLWWSEQSAAAYKKAKQCFVDYYDNQNITFTVKGATQTVSVKGVKTSQTSIRQTEAIRLSYYAYKNWMKINGQEKRTPGLPLTNDQIFFLAMAQAKCEARRPASGYTQALRGNYPEHVRINGALSHMEEFQDAFSCPNNSPMNAQPKCRIF